jgi:hypothetical protein
MQLTGTFKITDWKESVEKSFDDEGKLTTATVIQDYSGDITGKSEIKYQVNYESNGDVSFVGFEFIEGKIAGKSCKLTIKHDGSFDKGLAKSQFYIVHSSTHNELVGIKGSFESVEGGQAKYVISSSLI